MKVCNRCGEKKPLIDFYKHPKSKDGHLNQCKSCKIAYQKTRPTRSKEYRRNYYQDNKEKWKESWWRNRDKNLKRARVWKQNNSDLVRANNRKRRALKQNLEENFTPEDEAIILTLFSNRCFRCGSTDELTMDHHYPLSSNNALELDNAVVLCQSCNSKKHKKLPENFYSQQELDKLTHIHRLI